MSLLMEALRKAEEAKRRMQQQEPPAPGSPVAADTQRASVKSSGLTLTEREPTLTQEYILDNFAVDQAPAAEPSQETYRDAPRRNRYPDRDEVPQDSFVAPAEAYIPPVQERTSPRTLAKKQKNAAASVFVAKQKPAGNRKIVTILVVVMVLMIPLGGGALWYLQTMTPTSVGINPAVSNYDLSTRGFLGDELPGAPAVETTSPAGNAAPAVAITEPDTGLETATEALATTATAEPAPAVATVESTGDITPQINIPPATQTPVIEAQPALVVAGTEQTPLLLPATVAPDGATTAEPAAAGPVAVLEISRSGGSRTINPDLVTAYNRLQTGDLLVAGQLYQEVLNDTPNNRDALLGLALARLRQGNQAEAGKLYARLLQLNPRDPLAHAGLLQTMQTVDSTEHEAELKSLLAEYPGVAPLEMALGNLYASQQRWSEAQGAYYNALLNAGRSSDGPVHPDYAFNLAVSLEQLNQKKAALDYYRQAQNLALAVTPGFDPQLLNSRLAYLEQNQP